MNRDNPSKPKSAIPGNLWFLICYDAHSLNLKTTIFVAAYLVGDAEDPYPSLSDIHDYEPNLEFDDTELQQPVNAEGIFSSSCGII